MRLNLNREDISILKTGSKLQRCHHLIQRCFVHKVPIPIRPRWLRGSAAPIDTKETSLTCSFLHVPPRLHINKRQDLNESRFPLYDPDTGFTHRPPNIDRHGRLPRTSVLVRLNFLCVSPCNT